MTIKQEIAVERLKEKFLGFYGHPETKEFKELEIKEFENGIIRVFITVGGKNDEGTLAEIYCRKTLSVFIGKAGGYYNYSKSVKCYRIYYKTITDVCIKAQW